MKGIYLLSFLAIISLEKVSAQDHLEPSTDIFSSFNAKYRLEVREILIDGLTDVPLTQLVIIPSFSKEIVWKITHNHDLDKFYSVVATGTESIWYNKYQEKPKKIKPVIKEKEISKEVAGLIKQLFLAALNNVKYSSNNDNIWKVDGINYYFSSFDSGMKSGTIYSPDDESTMDRLVNICYKLINSTQKHQTLDKQFLDSVKQLTNEIKNAR